MSHPGYGPPPYQQPPQGYAPAPPPPPAVRPDHSGAIIAVAIAAILALVVAGAVWGGNQLGIGRTQNTGATTSDGKPVITDANYKQLAKEYTVTTVDTNCVKLVKSAGGETTTVANTAAVKYVVGALLGTPPRATSDSLSTPLSGANRTSLLRQVKVKVCQDPLLGVTVANMYSRLTIGNFNLVQYNPWLAPYVGDVSELNTKAAGFMPLLNVSNPTADQAKDAVNKGQKYQALAEKLDTLLGRGTNAGTKSLAAKLSYDLVAGGQEVNGVPPVQISSIVDRLPALVIEVTAKGACAPLAEYGFNLTDTRPEIFPNPTCAKPGKSTHKSTARPSSSTPPSVCSHCGGTTSHPPSSPPASHTCCITTTSGAQDKPTAGSTTDGSGPETTGPGTQPTSGIPTPAGSSDPNHGSDVNTPVPTPILH